MKVRIPVPDALTADYPYAVEFDSDKISGIQLSGGLGGSRLILDFADLEDAPKWARREGEGAGEQAAPIATATPAEFEAFTRKHGVRWEEPRPQRAGEGEADR